MQLFVRCVSGGTQVVALPSGEATLEGLEAALQASGRHVPGEFLYVAGGRQLPAGEAPLSALGVTDGATVSQTARLRGGKGGFGAMLRGAGRTGKLTDNFDACRDLSGRRVRHQEAEKKLAEWMADQKARELEKVAQQHIKKQLREEKLRAQEEMEAQLAKEVQITSIKGVKEAVTSGLAVAAGGDGKRKGAGSGSPPAKRKALKVWGMEDDLSDDSDSDSDDEGAPEVAGKGKAPAAPADASSSGDEGSTETKTRLPADAVAPKAATPAEPAAPEEAPASAAETAVETSAPAPVEAPHEPVDLGAYGSAEELQALGLERLKAELTARGLKCGGTLTQRAERLFLLKSTPLEAIDKAHRAKK